jgi:hypothetical protein
MDNIQLGPSHPLYGQPTGPAPSTNARRAVRRRAKAPVVVVVDEYPGSDHFTPGQLLREFGREHDRRSGGECPCPLCNRLRALVAGARGGGNGR